MFLTRLKQVGGLSLAALVLGGLILIFTGLNGLIGPTSINGKYSPLDDKMRAFRYGSQLSIQAWIVILGVGFGLLSYGFNETYIHLFDWWCSRQSQRDDGLDYGVYLNSQSRAPVLYGRRGFTGFITLRYLLTLASIATSIGYKFGVVKAELGFVGTLDLPVGSTEGLFLVRTNFIGNSFGDEQHSWLTDTPDANYGNRAFFHQDGESSQPPLSAIMTGVMSCSGLTEVHHGSLYTREVVVVANMTEVEGHDNPIAPEDTSLGWNRATSSGYDWFDSSDELERAVVEYRNYRTDDFDVRWAKQDWAKPVNYTLPVVRHIRYKMHYAVAEVHRHVKDGNCAWLASNDPPIQLLSNDDNPPVNSGSYTAHTDKWAWADSIITSSATNPREGVGSIIQIAMTIFLSTLETWDPDTYISPLRFVPAGSHPFGPESTPESRRLLDKPFPYPVLDGYGWTATGTWIPAAYIFVVIGSFAVLVALTRAYIGPPLLTSWMGQHIFLAQRGAICFSMAQEDLATGYKAARTGLGKLKL